MACISKKAIIPVALQFCFDDVGWDNGRDMRIIGQASRTGMPRYHALEDYEMLHEFGKALGQKVIAPICLADWDKDNLLRGQVGITHDPYGWDRKSEIDVAFFEKARDILDKSEYIEITVHGLLHGVYDEKGRRADDGELEYFTIVEKNGERKMVLNSDEDFDNRIRLFFEIYNSWGFTQKIRSFVSPGGFAYADLATVAHVAEKLSQLGIKYWANHGFRFPDTLGVYSDIAIMKKGGAFNGQYLPPPWEGYDIDPALFMPFVCEKNQGGTNVVGMHWPNILRFNPKRNLENLPLWIEYFNRERENFGTMIAKDIAHSATQQFYKEYATVDITDSKCVIDVCEACKRKTSPCPDEFYISFAKDVLPVGIDGGKMLVYEEHKEFTTYKIMHTAEKIIIDIL